MDGLPVHIAVLTIADDAAADRASGRAIAERATAVGHQIVDEEIAKDSESAIRDQLVRWIADDNVDVVIVAASIESEAASAALAPLVHQAVPGFTDLFRWLTFQEIGASAMLSAAEAAQCQSTFVFVLPAHEAAVRAAMDKLILPQLDVRTKPKNLVAQMPRLKDAAKRYAEAHKSQPVTAPPPVAAPVVPAPPTIPAVPRTDAVPTVITGEKTQGGSGLPARLPAAPSASPVPLITSVPAIPAAPTVPPRPKTRTANTIARKTDDPPTKPIDLAKLEKQIALSNANDAHTKEVDLKAHDAKTKVVDMSAHQAKTRVVDSRLLPRVPPGADDTAADLDDEPLTFSAPPGANPAQAQAQAQAQARTSAPIGVVKNRSDGTQPGTPAPTSRNEGTQPGTFAPTRPVTTPPFSTPVARSSATTPPSSAPVARSSATTPPTSAPVARSTSSPPPTPRATAATPPALPAAPPGPLRDAVLTPSTPVVALRDDDRKEAITPASPVVALRQDARKEAITPVANPILSRHDAITPVATPIVPRKEATTPATNPTQAPQRPRPPTPPPPPPARPGAAPNAAELWAQSMVPGATSEAAKPAAAAVEPTPEAAKADTASNGDSSASAAADAPSPISNLFANQPARKREPTPPPVHLESLAKPIVDGDLPQGDFAYPLKRSGAGVLLKIVLALAMLGIGFFAFIKLYPQDDKPTQTAAVTSPPAEPAPPPVTPPAAVADAAQAPEPAPADIEIDPAQHAATTPPSTPPSSTSPSTTSPSSGSSSSTPTRHGSSSHSSHGVTASRPVTTPADTSGDTKPADTKPADSNAADAKPGDKPEPAGDCDEVSCVLAKYDRPCCARYKPAEGFTPKNVVPDELDRAMVKSGVEKIKPKVVACGEQHAAKGTVRLAVTVDPDGNVKGASVTESPEAGLGECVAGAMRNAKFGKSVKGGEFNYPFVF